MKSHTNPSNIPVYLLAGGRSSRFGQDKARATAAQKTLLEHVATQTISIAASVTVIASQEDAYQDLGFRTIADHRPYLGPLAGLERALEDSPENWLLLGSCDTLGIQTSELNALLTVPRRGLQIIAWRGKHWEPLWALYHQSLLNEVQRRLQHKELRMQSLLNQTCTQALDNQHHKWIQINQPEDWLKAQSELL